ncbi:MAG: SDR family oxidoreductase [Micavibrio sp.]|nr:MAG: SDR family oxidoreductase [Micavibrio sp.]
MDEDKNPQPVPEFPRNKSLFCFGFGYTATALSLKLAEHGWTIGGTTTDQEKRSFLRQSGINAYLFDKTQPLIAIDRVLDGVTHLLLSVPPSEHGDISYEIHGRELAAMPNLEWAGYLSATSVYGNYDGKWVDEETPTSPNNRRGTLRLKAEKQWTNLYLEGGFPLHIFRLAGIYGPGRSALDVVRAGKARRIVKEGHVFNRIHIDDIVQVLTASMANPSPGEIYNLADDAPEASHAVIKYACELLGLDVPELIPYDEVDYLAPIVRSFYQDNKRIKNDKIKQDLAVKLLYPDYRAGLNACFAAEDEFQQA